MTPAGVGPPGRAGAGARAPRWLVGGALLLASVLVAGYAWLMSGLAPPAGDVRPQPAAAPADPFAGLIAPEPAAQGASGPQTFAATGRLAARVRAAAAAQRVVVRGIYIPAGITGQPRRLRELVELVRRTELNALVIDLKDDSGHLVYDSQQPLAERLGAERPRLRAPGRFLRRLRAEGIYTIARVVTFKDDVLARARPAWAVQLADGRPWSDRKGTAWSNPYHPEVRRYNLAVAREAALLGFREVQFDYVRFPSDGAVAAATYPGRDGREPKQVIGEFLRAARRALRPYNVAVSADVFGQVPSVRDDMGIGQRWEQVARGIDYISPMIYPSHYAPRVYGLADPDAYPYETVAGTLADAVERLPDENAAVIRPWLQDFSLRHRYGPDEVRAQIRAVYDAGLSQWLLWNARARYTEAALRDDATAGQEGRKKP